MGTGRPGMQCTFPGRSQVWEEQYPQCFPKKGFKNKTNLWPVDISHLLEGKLCPDEKESQESTSADATSKAVVAENESTAVLLTTKEPNDETKVREDANDACTCKKQTDRLLERIQTLETQREMERFGVKRFMLSDADILDFTLVCQAIYGVFLALYNFLKPRAGFQLNYYGNTTTTTPKHPSYVVSRGRPRNLIVSMNCLWP